MTTENVLDRTAAVPASTGPTTHPESRAAGGRGLRSDHPPAPWEYRLLTPLALIAVWQVASALGWLPAHTLAAPSQVAAKVGSLLADGTLADALGTSLRRAALGFLLGTLIALAAALPVGLSRLGDAAIDPPMQMLRTLPLLGLVPLFIVWFGIGEWPKILLVGLGVCVPLYLNLVGALRSIDPDLYELADALGLGRWQRIRHVIAPGALSGALVGVRQALAFAWLALIVAEQMSATSGLGFMINNARDFLQTDTIVVGLLTYAVLGLLTDAVVRWLERYALRWRASGGRAA
ncbi:ABC transporter permease [Calidifontibacter sp. DB0510]|uniref:ABC transporter permease n=1 Tax=Metallococcus carri TaxID=1656884 RepID=A0A967E9X5_9MICO|nr:ABC transporter permease [Metallococcus carri]NHN55680.1 ABC transporter permease [Metallococcus carri]NOP38136.1 ABC transporter permease [Calidifontibacter sp. DB2511S]